MQGWSRNATDETNEELRRVRKELTRGGNAPLRIMIAGDPTKPVLTFTISRRWPGTAAVAAALCAAALVLGGWRSASPSSLPAPPSVVRSEAIAAALYADRSTATAAPPAESAEEVRPAAPAKAVQSPKTRASALARAPEQPVLAKSEAPAEAEQFTIEVTNTGQVVEVKLDGPAGEPDEASYRTLRHALRCQRTGAENPIDPRLVELLHQISARAHERIQVVSAFRSPQHPRDLNYHVRGMAADIRVPGMSAAELRDLAKSLGANGVGYYPTVQFVHVDVRELPYFWTDTSGHNDNRQDEIAPAPADHAASASPSSDSAIAAASALGLLQPPSPPPPPAAPALLPSLAQPGSLPTKR